MTRPAAETLRLLVVDPTRTVREALQDLLAIELEAEVSVGSEVHGGSFDVALVDEHVAGAFPEAPRAALAALSERMPVVVMGLGEQEPYEEAHVAAGAVGYWPKDGDIDTLLALVRAAGLVACADRACVAQRCSATRRARAARTLTRITP